MLLYDGLCGFCDGLVQFILKSDRNGAMRFAQLQGDFARAVFARHPDLSGIDSLVLVEHPGTPQEHTRVRSDGALAIAEYLGGAWALAALLRIVPRAVADAAYDAFARVRYRAFGQFAECRVPGADVRARFID